MKEIAESDVEYKFAFEIFKETWMKAIFASDLPNYAKVVAAMLGIHLNRETRTAFPSQELLAEECGMSLRLVQYAINKLAERGYLTIEKNRSKRGQWLHDVYRPRLKPAAKDCAASRNRLQKPPATDCVLTSDIEPLNITTPPPAAAEASASAKGEFDDGSTRSPTSAPSNSRPAVAIKPDTPEMRLLMASGAAEKYARVGWLPAVVPADEWELIQRRAKLADLSARLERLPPAA